MALSISVAPLGDEWLVRAAGLADDSLFTGGGKAEAAARDLASQVARDGRSAELKIYLRDGSLAGIFHYPSHLGALAGVEAS
jgi:xanthine/CO dehydrogenase XdhC/CoxF family maturation factor